MKVDLIPVIRRADGDRDDQRCEPFRCRVLTGTRAGGGIAQSDDGLRIANERNAMWSVIAVAVSVALIVVGAARLAEATGFNATHEDREPETADESDDTGSASPAPAVAPDD